MFQFLFLSFTESETTGRDQKSTMIKSGGSGREDADDVTVSSSVDTVKASNVTWFGRCRSAWMVCSCEFQPFFRWHAGRGPLPNFFPGRGLIFFLPQYICLPMMIGNDNNDNNNNGKREKTRHAVTVSPNSCSREDCDSHRFCPVLQRFLPFFQATAAMESSLFGASSCFGSPFPFFL